jgi:CubicO group peptidase (beta-lactamase class C family)
MKTRFLFIATLVFQVGILQSQTGIPVPTMSDCDTYVLDFMEEFDIPGLTMAIAKDGKLVYMRAFGTSNLDMDELTQPYNLFRIASVSKPITSIAIMKLMEDGLLSLDDKVFGPGSLLENHAYISNSNITDPQIYDITVQHLLEHSCGWNRDENCTPNPTAPYPWFANNCDPIAFPLHVTDVLGAENPVAEQDLIRFLLEKGLNFAPGTSFAYSNIGYLTLGIIIEEITGLSYEDYVKTEILEPIGVCDMHLAKNLLEDKYEREGEYPPSGFQTLSVYGTGEILPTEYGTWNIEAFDAHGGWVATASDLIRVLVSVDKFTTKPDILLPSTIDVMIAPSVNAPYYAKGWSVNQWDNWWHTGAIDGTASNFVRTSGGFTFALILNKRVVGNQSNNFWVGLDNLPWNCISGVSSYPGHDLLLKPDVPSTNVTVSPIQANNATLYWTSGNGEKRIVIARANGPVDRFPLDGTNHPADSQFGSGEDLGNGNYVVYDGTGSSVEVSGLMQGTNYYFRVFEYNQNAATGNYPLYNLCNSEESVVTGVSESAFAETITISPNPAKDFVTVQIKNSHPCDEMMIYNAQGVLNRTVSIEGNQKRIPLHNLNTGLYHILFLKDGKVTGRSSLVKI